MSREGSVSPENFSQRLSAIDGRWKRFGNPLVTLRNNLGWLVIALIVGAFGTVAFFEARTSGLEARLLSAFAAKLTYTIGAGPSSAIAFPSSGPFNEARGYAGLPGFATRLKNAGFHIAAQVRLSPALERLSHWSITPPFREPPVTGLVVRDEDRAVLYDAGARQRVFDTYEDIPPLVAKALLLVENRELESSDIPTRNPVVDWGRLGKAGLMYAGHKVGLPFPVEGGSTLATQIEKFRYAGGGRTNSAFDKVRQMIGASLRVYRSGTDTRPQRREIVLDYLNSVPLAAAPRYGEVYGIGNGLYAWFGIGLDEANFLMANSPLQQDRERIFKHIVALICAARAPTFYLMQNRSALEERVSYYVRQMEAAGTITSGFARGVEAAPLEFQSQAPAPRQIAYTQRKATNAFRNHLMAALGVPDLYTLDRLHLDAETTLNAQLQNEVLTLFSKLQDPAFVESQGLRQEHLLLRGDPAQINYSFTLFERTRAGNVLRVQADTLNQPFDLNEGMKLELGSTAKVRTLAHYLELVSSLHHDFSGLDATAIKQKMLAAHDPITHWAAETMSANPAIDLPALLSKALDREYSGNPGEVFFTGGGAHVFANFDSEENGERFTLRDGLYHSVNLVYIRLMRDLVRFHQARLSYDTEAVLNQSDDPDRVRMLNEIADSESRHVLFEAYKTYRGLNASSIVEKLLGSRSTLHRQLAMVFFAWNPEADADALRRWLESNGTPVSSDDEAAKLLKSYDPRRLNISDYGYLLNRHPLDVWCAGQIASEPDVSWDDLLKRSGNVRELSSRWLFQTRNRRAQDLRLRIRFEQDAFARMTAYWRNLGFPFEHLVPSLATAIGSSADRPVALAELMGIVLNDGVRLPVVRLEKLRFAADTPYETLFEAKPQEGERVMEPEVAQALREVLAGVVQNGTAKRLVNAFVGKNGKPVMSGGKTGSGDNRYETKRFSQAVSRTGTFAFYIGDRYFGVMTAYVGANAANYVFTSALPVTAMKLLAPTLTTSLGNLE